MFRTIFARLIKALGLAGKRKGALKAGVLGNKPTMVKEVGTFQKFYRLLRPFTKEFLFICVCVLGYEMYSLAQSSFVGIQVGILEKGGGEKELKLFMLAALVYELMFTWYDNWLDIRITKLMLPIYEHLNSISMEKFMLMDRGWHQRKNSGELLGQVRDGIGKIDEMLNGLVWELIPTAFQALVSLAVLVVLSLLASGLFLLALLIHLVVTKRQDTVEYPLRKTQNDGRREAWRMEEEMVSAHHTIVTASQEERVLAQYRQVHNQIIDLGNVIAKSSVYRFGRPKMWIMSIFKRVILLIFGMQVVEGSMMMPQFLFASEVVNRLFSSLGRMSRLIVKFMHIKVSVNRLYELLSETPEVTSPTNPIPAPHYPITIEFQGVGFGYNHGSALAVTDLNFAIHQGEFVGIVGLSGAGKSTLVELISRMHDPTTGRVLINGRDAREYDLPDVRGLVSYVLQDAYIFDDTVVANLAFGSPGTEAWILEESARLASLHDFIAKELPDGYETLVGQRGIKLSGGQRQRLGLARGIAMALHPSNSRPIVVLDEATGSLDPITAKQVKTSVGPALRKANKTVLVIAHNLALLDGLVDRIIVMREGRVVEEGDHYQLLSQGGLYSRLWEAESRGNVERRE